MAEDKLESDEGVKEWLARRVGENLPPRPRPRGPRPAPRPAPPVTSPTPRPASPRLPGARPPAPVSVGPAPRRLSFEDVGFVLPDGGRPTENEDTGDLLDDTAPSARRGELTPPSAFPVDEPSSHDPPTQRIGSALSPMDARWGGPTTPDVDPFPGPQVSATPPAPDAFTADERFPSPPFELLAAREPPIDDLLPVGGSLEMSLSIEDSGSLDLPSPFAPTADPESDSDPVTRKLPPTEDEERKTGELDVHLPDFPRASSNPTPTLERPEPGPDLHPPIAASAVLEASETAKLPEPPPSAGYAPPSGRVDGPMERFAGPVPGFEVPPPADEFLFPPERDRDTVVLPDEDEEEAGAWSSAGMWIALGLGLGVVGFALVLSLLAIWLWLFAT